MQKIDEDRPLTELGGDEYGFAPIAEKLAASLVGLADSDGIVFGVEGPWGSGKTSFLNFLRSSLKSSEKIHVLALSPWLTGDSKSLVALLADALAHVLEQIEGGTGKKIWLHKRKKIIKSADLVRSYAARTGRGIVPLAKLAALAVPGASMAGEILELSAKALDNLGYRQSDDSLKAEVSRRIRSSGVSFVVLIDDLDRLEPAQAVEVMRLIRSVADFPRVVYILCYDREVLAHALETGLSVKDGDLYLQKIVQLTFALPLPEPFDLRNALRRKCLELFRSVNGKDPTDDLRSDIFHAIDREGSSLRTPRDVKLVLNSLTFIYPTVAEEIYFPDLCRIHLLRVLRPQLYKWIEGYLGIRAAVVSGDATVSQSERSRMGVQLQNFLPDDDRATSNSIWGLRTFIPGIIVADAPENRVFQQVSQKELADSIADRRVGSPLHYRFYFALSAPKAIISPIGMKEIRTIAGQSVELLSKKLRLYIEDERPLGKSWYEHLIIRLSEEEIKAYDFNELAGLALGFSSTAGFAQEKLEGRQWLMVSLGHQVRQVVGLVLRRMRSLDSSRIPTFLYELYQTGDLSWLVGYFHRQELFDHGLVGDRVDLEELRFLKADEVIIGGSILESRIVLSEHILLSLPNFGAFVWGWRDLSGVVRVKKWITEHLVDDKDFIEFLDKIRNWAMSDKVYYPLSRSAVTVFFDYEEVVQRLDRIYDSAIPDMVARVEDLRLALKQGDRD